MTYLTTIGVAHHELATGATMFGNIKKSEMGKDVFKKVYREK